MVGSWLLKVVAGVAAMGFLLFELGTPVVARVQLDDIAQDAADSAGRDLRGGKGLDEAHTTATSIVGDRGGQLDAFEVRSDGKVHVTISKRAESYVLDRFDQLRSWYEVNVDAVSAVGVTG